MRERKFPFGWNNNLWQTNRHTHTNNQSVIWSVWCMWVNFNHHFFYQKSNQRKSKGTRWSYNVMFRFLQLAFFMRVCVCLGYIKEISKRNRNEIRSFLTNKGGLLFFVRLYEYIHESIEYVPVNILSGQNIWTKKINK